MTLTIIELPHVGESVTEGVIVKWLVEPGQHVRKYDPLVEVVRASRRPGKSVDTKVLIIENLLSPGPSQPKNSRSRPSTSTDTCW